MGFLSEAGDKLTHLEPFHPFPAWGDREGWAQAEMQDAYIALAQSLSQEQWDVLPAWRYMDFQRDGNRKRYEDIYFERRGRVMAFALAECMEGKGRFMEGVINGLWAILEESSWVLPAHNNHYPEPYCDHKALPDTEAFRYIDLFCAETGALVAAIYGLLKEPLDAESPLIARRCQLEMETRIFRPYLARDDMHWMGLQGQDVNNWNPWINQNLLFSFLLMETDEARKLAAAKKAMKSVQSFLNMYAPDGGCDEGPSYFSVAGACYLDLCEMLYEVTNGEVDLFCQEHTRNIAGYQYAAHIAGRWFTNYADAPCALQVNGRQFVRLADKLGAPELADYGWEQEALCAAPNGKARVRQPYRFLKGLFTHMGARQPICRAVRGKYYPGIQVCMAREKQDSHEGFFFSAKGGHNQEGHNHNDVGTFLLYLNGEPVVIDAGVGEYTAKTFSDRRYEIWTMGSEYHNVPRLSGMSQKNGIQYRAEEVEYRDDGETVEFSMDLSRAYPEGCRAKRRFVFSRREGKLSIEDRGDHMQEHFLLRDKPRLENGCVYMSGARLTYDPNRLMARLEERTVDDEAIRAGWERDSLWSLILEPVENAKEWVIRFDHAEGN